MHTSIFKLRRPFFRFSLSPIKQQLPHSAHTRTHSVNNNLALHFLCIRFSSLIFLSLCAPREKYCYSAGQSAILVVKQRTSLLTFNWLPFRLVCAASCCTLLLFDLTPPSALSLRLRSALSDTRPTAAKNQHKVSVVDAFLTKKTRVRKCQQLVTPPNGPAGLEPCCQTVFIFSYWYYNIDIDNINILFIAIKLSSIVHISFISSFLSWFDIFDAFCLQPKQIFISIDTTEIIWNLELKNKRKNNLQVGINKARSLKQESVKYIYFNLSLWLTLIYAYGSTFDHELFTLMDTIAEWAHWILFSGQWTKANSNQWNILISGIC